MLNLLKHDRPLLNLSRPSALQLIFCVGAVLTLMLYLPMLVPKSFFDINYTLNQFLMTYEHEFVKRALTISLFEWFSGTPNGPDTFFHYGYVLFLLVSMTFIGFIAWSWRSHLTDIRTGCFIAAILLCIMTLSQWYFDYGRSEQVCTVLLMITLWVTHYTSYAHRYRSLLCILVLCSLMLFIHEASYFMFIPVCLIAWLYQQHHQQLHTLKQLQRDGMASASVFAILTGLTFLISTYGQITTVDYDTYTAFIIDQIGEDRFMKYSIDAFYHGGIYENMMMTIRVIQDNQFEYFIMNMMQVFFLTPFLFIIYGLLNSLITAKLLTRYDVLLLLSCFSITPMYILGFDHVRWSSILLTNFILCLCFMLANHPNKQSVVLNQVETDKYKYLLHFIFGLLFGNMAF